MSLGKAVNLNSLLSLTSLLGLFVAGPLMHAQSSGETQKVTLNEKVKIPGATLKPGDYTFSIEDRLQDRAIVRITGQDQNEHFLVLSVPNAKLGQSGSDGLIRFTTSKGKDAALKGWACPSCSPSLEFVYPKAEAVKLTDDSAEPVVAVDPTYDKLPANLSPDDMKVVTLWLLAPETITAGNQGKGVKAEKWASAAQPAAADQSTASNTTELAQSPAPAAPSPAAHDIKPATAPDVSAASRSSELAQTPTAAVNSAPAATPSSASTTEMASNTPPSAGRSRLPKTAGDDYLYLFCGTLLIAAALSLKLSRLAAVPAK
jgi:hypothetical protein